MLSFNFKFEVPGRGIHSAQGEFQEGLKLALMGPSGCGKSTFLKCLCGLSPRVSGNVSWKGKELNKALLNDGVLGFSFQNSPLFPHLSVSENLEIPFRTLLNFKMHSHSVVKEKVKASLQKAGLEALSGRWPQDLSGGEKKRISLLRAMIFNAPLLVLDEPFSDLDIENRRAFKAWLSEMVQEHRGILLYVTHSEEDLTFSNAKMHWPDNPDDKTLSFGLMGVSA